MKHPAVLVLLGFVLLLLLGFVLTDLLGGLLTHVQEAQQREREATVKSMDNERAAMDDLSATSSEYFQKTARLIDLRESGASPTEISIAQRDYQAAYDKWMLRLSTDMLNIRKRYPGGHHSSEADQVTLEVQFATDNMNDCIMVGALRHRAQLKGGKTNQLVCSVAGRMYDIAAKDELIALSGCLAAFTEALRPDPKSDFSRTSQIDSDDLKDARKKCDVRLIPMKPALDARQ
jgi:hypothetical protein